MAKSPWTALASIALPALKKAPDDERAVALLCNYFAEVYRQGSEDQQKLDRERTRNAEQAERYGDNYCVSCWRHECTCEEAK